MTKQDVISKIKQTGLVAVIRGNDEKDALKKIEDCADGGITAIELTFTVPYAHNIIESIAKRFEGGQIIVGAGTVLDSETARIAILSGAEFVVSPGLSMDTIKLCNRYQKAVMPGIMTVTEAITAMEAGAEILKLFPGELFGPAFIKALLGPLPHAQIMPTGGVNLNNISDWIKAGAVALGAGSLLTKGDTAANVREFISKIKQSRGE
ncbi:MAG: bifunctional 2-keto-4-hydroxyglutarate aldolase/2-keto-3-deoxy-6-phosphogluconate aldolase [Oscillospiraceae bacterium]|nr:bifunctional 2-keto-4-hydroxyglutarate aldolase/2-keto-3-deoxy-6-phosphogluconate aldolase [Oscillospiraceae bacterium]